MSHALNKNNLLNHLQTIHFYTRKTSQNITISQRIEDNIKKHYKLEAYLSIPLFA